MQVATNTSNAALLASLPAIVRTLLSFKGQILTLQIGRECKMRKGVTGMVHKFSKMQVRVGIDYDNIAAVQEKRESGELPAENAGRAWGSYVPGLFPYVIEHKGQIYFHFSTLPNSSFKSEVHFMRDGKPIEKSEVATLCLASETTERETTLECFDLKVESILEINGQPV
jgi:hypothetical protein